MKAWRRRAAATPVPPGSKRHSKADQASVRRGVSNATARHAPPHYGPGPAGGQRQDNGRRRRRRHFKRWRGQNFWTWRLLSRLARLNGCARRFYLFRNILLSMAEATITAWWRGVAYLDVFTAPQPATPGRAWRTNALKLKWHAEALSLQNAANRRARRTDWLLL